MIRVALVEDQTLVREGIKGLLALEPEIQIVADACDGEQAVTAIAACRPDVVLLDMRLPRLSGLDVLKRLGSSREAARSSNP
jgi:DNA-binding NarL/FixJ family response regulator